MAAPRLDTKFSMNITVMSGPHNGVKYSFEKPVVSIGRDPENDIVLANDPKVSRKHAEIRLRGSEFILVNVSSKNFILLNDIDVGNEVIANSSFFKVGESDLKFEFKIEIEAPRVESVDPRSLQVAKNAPPLQPLPNMGAGAPVTRPTMPPQQRPAPNPGPLGRGQAKSGARPRPKQKPDDSRFMFYGIIAIIAVVGYVFFSGPVKPKKDKNTFKSTNTALIQAAEAEKRNQELMDVQRERYDTIENKRAQENFVKGFRDYQQGQYARARDSFQVVLNLDPENSLAKRYFHLSKVKFDELVKFNMIQGNRYREKKNWRMCQSNYSNVMTMLQYSKNDPTYREAKQYFEECRLNLEGRF